MLKNFLIMRRKEHHWMYQRLNGRRLRSEFIEGVDGFVDFCLQHPVYYGNDKIRCPFFCCRNKRYLNVLGNGKVHLYSKGFTSNYYEWKFHGEADIGLSSSVQSNPYRDMIVDALGNEHVPIPPSHFQGSMSSALCARKLAAKSGGRLPTVVELYLDMHARDEPGKGKVVVSD